MVVRVPATSANLGPGFDALGLALALYDVVEAQVTPGGLTIEVAGEGADTAAVGEWHLVVRAMRAAFGLLGGQPPGIALRCGNAIPHSRGLGSSAAAIVAGVLAARGLVTDGAAVLPDEAVFRLAVDLEGHADNVAACLVGGLTIAWTAPPGAGHRPFRGWLSSLCWTGLTRWCAFRRMCFPPRRPGASCLLQSRTAMPRRTRDAAPC